jgi:hypothetical protein
MNQQTGIRGEQQCQACNDLIWIQQRVAELSCVEATYAADPESYGE